MHFADPFHVFIGQVGIVDEVFVGDIGGLKVGVQVGLSFVFLEDLASFFAARLHASNWVASAAGQTSPTFYDCFVVLEL